MKITALKKPKFLSPKFLKKFENLDLLFFLVQHPNEFFSKEQLFEKIWSFDPIGEPATVTVHINRLRDKLKNAAGHPYERIETVWGSGYRFHLD